IWICHSKSKKDSIYSPGCTDCSNQIKILAHRYSIYTIINTIILRQRSNVLYVLNSLLYQSRTYSTYNIEKQKTLAPPMLFKGTTKHPYSKHIEEYMLEVCMHEHISYKLD